MKQFKLTRKVEPTVTEPQFKIGGHDYPEKFVTFANGLFKELAVEVGNYIVYLHDNKTITSPECFNEFYTDQVFVRNQDTIQVNFKSKTDPYMLLQATYNRQGGAGANKKLTFVVSAGHLHSADQSIISDSIIHSDVCKQDDDVLAVFAPLQKLLTRVSKFLNDLRTLNEYL